MKRDALYGSLAFCVIGLIANATGAPGVTIISSAIAFFLSLFWIWSNVS